MRLWYPFPVEDEETEMSETSYNFGPVARLEPDAVGPPGQRTFRLLVSGEDGTASLWLEKEELQALGMAIDQLMARLSGRPEWKMYGAPPPPFEPTEEAVADPSVEFKVAQLSLGFETNSGMFVLLVYDSEDDPSGAATFTCMATATQMRTLGRRIESLVVSGRPRCVLCEEPLDGDEHVCIRAN
jgi:uncharacterized repeat protein (TIGR03847 family)